MTSFGTPVKNNNNKILISCKKIDRVHLQKERNTQTKANSFRLE